MKTLADKIEEGERKFRGAGISAIFGGVSFVMWDQLNRLLLNAYEHPGIFAQYGNQAQTAEKIVTGMAIGLGALAVGLSLNAVIKYTQANELYKEVKRKREQTRVHYLR